MKVDMKDWAMRLIDPMFYPDISGARRVSDQIRKAASMGQPSTRIEIDEKWRYQSRRRRIELDLLAPAPDLYTSIADNISYLVRTRDREAIDNALRSLMRLGRVIS